MSGVKFGRSQGSHYAHWSAPKTKENRDLGHQKPQNFLACRRSQYLRRAKNVFFSALKPLLELLDVAQLLPDLELATRWARAIPTPEIRHHMQHTVSDNRSFGSLVLSGIVTRAQTQAQSTQPASGIAAHTRSIPAPRTAAKPRRPHAPPASSCAA